MARTRRVLKPTTSTRRYVEIYYRHKRLAINDPDYLRRSGYTLEMFEEFNPQLFARLEANWQANRLEKE